MDEHFHSMCKKRTWYSQGLLVDCLCFCFLKKVGISREWSYLLVFFGTCALRSGEKKREIYLFALQYRGASKRLKKKKEEKKGKSSKQSMTLGKDMSSCLFFFDFMSSHLFVLFCFFIPSFILCFCV